MQHGCAIPLGRDRTLAGDVAQPADRKRLLEPHEQKTNLHGEGLVQKGGIDGLQCLFQRQPLLGAQLMEDILKLKGLLDVETLRG